MGQRLLVDGHGLRLPPSMCDPVEVRIDDRVVWRFDPARERRLAAGSLVAWPHGMRLRSGTAEVSLMVATTGQVLFNGTVCFGDSAELLRLVDANGHLLTVDKSGRLQRTFGDVDPDVRRQVVEAAARVLDGLDEEGLGGFLSYGALLGAVRTGRLIDHDSDVDMSYLSRHTHPVDVLRESRQLGRSLRRRGWQVVRSSGADMKVLLPLRDGGRCGIDVFAAFYVGDRFHLMGSLRGTFDRAAVLPRSSVTLEGQELPAPARPEDLLAFTYGPGWRTPDPAFHFDHDPVDVRRMDGWFRAPRRRLRYWYDFYRSPASRRVPTGPSPFATWVSGQVEPRSTVLDVGTGTGRDAAWLASRGLRVCALDFVNTGRPTLRRLTAAQDVSVRFSLLNLESLQSTLLTAARFAHRPGTRHVYARGVLDVVGPAGRRNLWRFASMVQRRSGRTYLEFRTPRDRTAPKVFGEHLRTYPDPDEVVREIAAVGGLVLDRVVGRGLAPLEFEDPEMCRLVVRWDR